MLEFHELKELLSLFDNSSLSSLHLEQDGSKLVLKKEQYMTEKKPPYLPIEEEQVEKIKQINVSPAPVVMPMEDKKEESFLTITSPVVGTFYSSPSPDKSSYVQVGDVVKKGQTVCIVEAMKLFNEIESDFEGRIAEILVQNGEVVEYGQPLFHIRPN